MLGGGGQWGRSLDKVLLAECNLDKVLLAECNLEAGSWIIQLPSLKKKPLANWLGSWLL